MRRLLLGLALFGVGMSIAVSARNDFASEPATLPAIETEQLAPGGRGVTAPVTAPIRGPQPEADGGEERAREPEQTTSHAGDVAPAAEPAPQPAAPDSAARQEDAASILRAASDAYETVRTLQADFVQRLENPLLRRTTTSRGTLYQLRPDRFLMRFSEPAGDVIVSDGRHFWVYYPSVDEQQVIRFPAARGAGAVDLQAQFLGDPVRRFDSTLHGTEEVAGRSAHVLTMVPREDAGYRSLRVWIDTRDHLARRFEITENNGGVRRFELSNLRINGSLDEALFRFTPPEGANIIDRG